MAFLRLCHSHTVALFPSPIHIHTSSHKHTQAAGELPGVPMGTTPSPPSLTLALKVRPVQASLSAH